MHYRIVMVAILLLAGPVIVTAEDQSEVAQLRQMLDTLRHEYDSRIAELEKRLLLAERLAQDASRNAGDAIEIAEDTAISATAGASAPNTFNPAIGVTVAAGYADVDRGWDAIPGFLPGGELGPGGSGFSLGESELNLNANVDSRIFGNLTLALEDDDGETEIGLEEAWIQTTSLPGGLSLGAGRFFSALGYLNKFHRHADAYFDRPLPYQAFFGGQQVTDGIQARWIAPTSILLEFGAELNWGGGFPATGNAKTSTDSWSLFGKTGGDLGFSHSWQAGIGFSSTDVIDRAAADAAVETFSGDSDLTVIDFVWKWAPAGNPTVRNVTLQGEHFWRDEQGDFAGFAYDGEQSGWYLQGLWQFIPRWRLGYRHDEVSSDNGPLLAGTALEDARHTPRRDSLLLDWSWSEFSRVRLQFTDDNVLNSGDRQFFISYIMSIGAHGAHEF